MRGRIIKGVGGLYDVHVGGDRIYACRARGIFRKKKIRPNVGDYVEIEILSEQDMEGSITVIHDRRNSLIRPMVANVDQALLVFVWTKTIVKPLAGIALQIILVPLLVMALEKAGLTLNNRRKTA